jgi:effector-binding domain-containing protein
LTVKALRHYDELGLLRPALTDPDSGYRYYSLAQAQDGHRIRLLREVDMPLEEIGRVVRERDPDAIREILDRHRQRIQERLEETRRVLDLVYKLIDQEGEMTYSVQVKKMQAQPLLSLRTRTSLASMDQTFGSAFSELFGYLGEMGVSPVGPPMTIYHDPEFKEDDIDLEICVPIEKKLAGRGNLNGWTSPEMTVAFTLYSGPYTGIGAAYQALSEWIQSHGHETAGPHREIYLVSPQQASDPSEYRTEVVWPIR